MLEMRADRTQQGHLPSGSDSSRHRESASGRWRWCGIRRPVESQDLAEFLLMPDLAGCPGKLSRG